MPAGDYYQAARQRRRRRRRFAREDNTLSWVRGVLAANKEKNFVQRILEPTKWPSLDLGNGMSASHLMSWATIGEERTPVVYPTVIYDDDTKSLVNLGGKGGLERALKTGEYISFADERSADLFSREYKRVWDK